MKKNNKLQIYGLQAIAVVAIILYHAQITIYDQQLFKGGFIGVDIFFVISGYLITSIILKELIATDSFSFKNFYERRIRQIFPLLLLVILASLPFAWFYLLPTDQINFSKSIITLLSFSSNFYFYYSGNAFGELGFLPKPLIHTWLISVLVQFYILFPITLLIVFRYFRKYLIHILILGFVISLGLADWGSRNYPSFNFYVLPTRVWELLAGSILAYFEITLGHRSKNKTLNLILPSIGLFLIGHAILFFNDKMFYPSFYTLSPIIGVCLIIWFLNKNDLINKILSSKLFVAIGLISYSLYLWHYPVFAFTRIKNITPSQYEKFEWIVLTIVLSIISYLLIERPARNKKNKFKLVVSLLITSIFFIAIILSYQISKNSKFTIISGDNGFSFNNNQLVGKGKNKFILFGDSLGLHVMSYLKDISLSRDMSFYNVTHSTCISLPNITNYYNPQNIKKFKLRKSCTNLYKNINLIIKSNKNEPIVIFYNSWFKHIIKNDSRDYNEHLKFNDDPNQNDRVIRAILNDIIKLKKINKASKKWIVVGKTPGSYNYDFKGFLNCYSSKKSYFRQPFDEVTGCEKKGLIENGTNYLNHKLFKKIIASDYSNDLIYIDTYELYCDEIYCYNFTNENQLIYKDHHHFTYEGSKKIVKKILKIFYELQ